MKWFKHNVDAGDDMFIWGLMDKFGPQGYWVFFRTLELMGQDFKPKTPGVITENLGVLRQKFRMRGTTLKRILDYCDEKNKFCVSYHGNDVTIMNSKFKQMVDDYAVRLLRNKPSSYNGTRSTWVRIQKAIRKRDKYKCVVCGKTTYENHRSLDVHHIIPFMEFDDPDEANTPSNLVTLCATCHGEAQDGKYDELFGKHLGKNPNTNGYEPKSGWVRPKEKNRIEKKRSFPRQSMDTTNGGWLSTLIPGVFKKLKRGEKTRR